MTEDMTWFWMTGPELLAVSGAVALVLVRWLPPGARRATAGAGGGAVLVGGTLAALTGGLRWQVAPVFAAAVLVAPFAVVPLLPRRTGREPRRARWWLAAPASAACLVLVAAGPAAAWAFPVPAFPRPTGPYAVGTRVVEWTDGQRPEPATADPGDRRTVVVQFWYPAEPAPGAGRARYLGRTAEESRTVADALADYAGLPGLLLDGPTRARTWSVPDAAVAAGGGRFPVVLFSPGLGGVRGQNTAWAEELASHGYVVAGLDHPYDSAAVVLADGRTVRTRVSSTGDRAEDERRAVGWTEVRAADLGFVLGRLQRIGRGQDADPLAGRLDTERVAAAGHSLGGAAALLAARRNEGFAAVIDLDGAPHDAAPQPLHRPLLALTQEIGPQTDPDYLPALDKVLDLDTTNAYRLTVPGTAHLTFTDAPLYLPPIPALVGTRDRIGGPRLTATASLAFLDGVLRGLPGDPATALAPLGGLTVHRAGGAG
ncbi:alpha/beta hydrolase family protein [Kitasatospora sp. DSM 101779]|uniref:alpha/beta hydrolase family protein n=1 Tax=Kitasatospora sp. DSM 101779 TaxID=2853165 RepID=UPI003985EA48